MGVAWLLPNVNNPSYVSDYASTANYSFPCGGVVKHRKAQVRHGVFINSTQHCCWVWMSVWPHCGVGISMSNMLPSSTRCGPQTCVTSRCKWGLAIHLCTTEWCHGSCAYQIRGMSAPWQTVHPAPMPTASCISCKCTSCCCMGRR